MQSCDSDRRLAALINRNIACWTRRGLLRRRWRFIARKSMRDDRVLIKARRAAYVFFPRYPIAARKRSTLLSITTKWRQSTSSQPETPGVRSGFEMSERNIAEILSLTRQ